MMGDLQWPSSIHKLYPIVGSVSLTWQHANWMKAPQLYHVSCCLLIFSYLPDSFLHLPGSSLAEPHNSCSSLSHYEVYFNVDSFLYDLVASLQSQRGHCCRYNNNPWEYGYVEYPKIIIISRKFDISLPFLKFICFSTKICLFLKWC